MLHDSEKYKIICGDCVEEIAQIKSDSIHYSIFSPPFASLYTYSDHPADMGNCSGISEFISHFQFLADELFRVIKPGRLVSIHCMDMPTLKSRDGFIGIYHFAGDLCSAMQKAGFIYHSKVTIWKDPVVAMQRTKALGLLHKQIRKDAAMCRQGIPDELWTFRKDGVNDEPVENTHSTMPVAADKVPSGSDIRRCWQNYASPVWMDINPSKTLQRESAREEKDERHICPLQLEVIERGIDLWTNENDIVFSPFAGIGSEGYVAIKMNRRFIGIELKESYAKQATKNIEIAIESKNQMSIF
ncbi:MAG: site-specific DNA-methyltransferase [Patescibacteria group bacterium]|jgi:DNA modification methylase